MTAPTISERMAAGCLLPVALGVADDSFAIWSKIVLDRRDEDRAESGIVAPRGVRGQRRQNAPGTWIVAMGR